MILKDGMYIEALNNKGINDSNTTGGNYITESDIGTIYKPGGDAALPYVWILGDEIISNHDFSIATTTSATSGVENWTIQTNMIGAHDAINNTLEVDWLAAAGSTSGLESDLITLENEEEYRLVADVLEIDNNVGGIGVGLVPTPRVVVVGMNDDGTWNSDGYYPLPGTNPTLQVGINQWTFTVDSTLNNSSSKFVAKIEFYDTNQGYDKMIKLKKVSLTTSAVD